MELLLSLRDKNWIWIYATKPNIILALGDVILNGLYSYTHMVDLDDSIPFP